MLEHSCCDLFERTPRRFHGVRAEPFCVPGGPIDDDSFSNEVIEGGLPGTVGFRRRQRDESICDRERVTHAVTAAEDTTFTIQHDEHIIGLRIRPSSGPSIREYSIRPNITGIIHRAGTSASCAVSAG